MKLLKPKHVHRFWMSKILVVRLKIEHILTALFVACKEKNIFSAKGLLEVRAFP
jgi:hypothetical protein